MKGAGVFFLLILAGIYAFAQYHSLTNDDGLAAGQSLCAQNRPIEINDLGNAVGWRGGLWSGAISEFEGRVAGYLYDNCQTKMGSSLEIYKLRSPSPFGRKN